MLSFIAPHATRFKPTLLAIFDGFEGVISCPTLCAKNEAHSTSLQDPHEARPLVSFFLSAVLIEGSSGILGLIERLGCPKKYESRLAFTTNGGSRRITANPQRMRRRRELAPSSTHNPCHFSPANLRPF